ncbi:hypothetical protein ACV3UL_08540 [Clostridium perfringens]
MDRKKAINILRDLTILSSLSEDDKEDVLEFLSNENVLNQEESFKCTEEHIESAKKILRDNNYAVVYKTDAMNKDINECEEMQCTGEDKECLGCSCSVCIMQY